MADSLMISPTQIYQINGQVSKVKSVMLIQTVAANQIAITAVSGKILRVMGLSLTANAAGTNPGVVLKNGNGGATLYAVTIPACTVGEHARPIVDCGYFETSVGVGLYMDITAATANLFINYIEY